MKYILVRISLIFILLLNVPFFKIIAEEPAKYTISMSIYKDLSDTYLGGNFFTGEVEICKKGLGINVGFGFFQSQGNMEYTVNIENLNKSIEIPVKEMGIMKSGSISGFLRPVQKKWLNVDLLLGLAYGKAKNFMIKEIDYSYDLNESKFIYLTKDYQLIKKSHFGYQVGFDISFIHKEKVGLQLKSRIQGLSNQGSFFFIGGGICFRL